MHDPNLMGEDVLMAEAGIKRGCGYRVENGVYLEVGTSEYGGQPLEHFLCDPPIPYVADHKIGVDILTGPDGVNHVIDHVGSKHYPWPSDVLEEGRRHGFSRRVPKNLDFSKLSAGSRLILVHSRAVLQDPNEYHRYLSDELRHHCRLYFAQRDKEHLEDLTIPCTRDWYAAAPATDVNEEAVMFTRSFSETVAYRVHPPHPEAPPPAFASGIIASLPITNVTVIKAGDGSHQETVERIAEQLQDIRLTERES